MFDKNNLNEIKRAAEEFFEKTGFEVEINNLGLKDQTVSLGVKTGESGVLIGSNGQTLVDIQRLLKTVLRKKIEGEFYFDLDINDYKKKKEDYLKETAKFWADQVSLTKEEHIFSIMPSYERRIVHLELAGRSDIKTESIGEEPERRIIIKLC